jgi:hypothetical protein
MSENDGSIAPDFATSQTTKPSTRPATGNQPVPPSINRPVARPARPKIPGGGGSSTRPSVRPNPSRPTTLPEPIGRPNCGGGGFNPGAGNRPGGGGSGYKPGGGFNNRPTNRPNWGNSIQVGDNHNFASENPDAAYSHFLMGYHYMVCGYNDESIEQFKFACKLEPSDQLARSLVAMLGGKIDDDPIDVVEMAEQEQAIIDIDPLAIFGRWKTNRENASNIDLQLNDDGKFSWIVGGGGNPITLTGEYSLGGDKLALQPDSGGPMVGTVSNVGAEAFTFRIVGATPGDKGIQFGRL